MALVLRCSHLNRALCFQQCSDNNLVFGTLLFYKIIINFEAFSLSNCAVHAHLIQVISRRNSNSNYRNVCAYLLYLSFKTIMLKFCFFVCFFVNISLVEYVGKNFKFIC